MGGSREERRNEARPHIEKTIWTVTDNEINSVRIGALTEICSVLLLATVVSRTPGLPTF